MNINFCTSLKMKLEGDIAMARSNIDVFMNNPVGVGEHGDIMTTIEEQFAVIANARDKLAEVNNYINRHTDVDDMSKSHAREMNDG